MLILVMPLRYAFLRYGCLRYGYLRYASLRYASFLDGHLQNRLVAIQLGRYKTQVTGHRAQVTGHYLTYTESILNIHKS